ncbi:hypothetical protein NDU88_003771 [Pleurodeles waltl]|uniref:Uncharacterized protein n=1 Tax=Pleurodeles waltl TaxID=8319 RepID=A0AAV7VEB5_PLEWA|nr:hypothetical protein NDU88_003771 [Pleurodeles waltl]
MSVLETKGANHTSAFETTTLTPLEKFKLDEKYLHDYTNAQGELSSNIFYRLLIKYVETMDAKDCLVCTQIPSSLEEGVTYHSLPLTYGISCSLLITRFYNQEYIQYFYSNLDLVFSFVPIVRYLSRVAKDNDIVLVRGFFEPTLTFGTAYAHRNNLTCLLTPLEKRFLDHTDDRRKALKEKLEKGLEKRT